VYGVETSIQELTRLAVQYRTEIIQHIGLLSDEQIVEEYSDGDGNVFTVDQYMRDFFDHDRHHMSQLIALARRNS